MNARCLVLCFAAMFAAGLHAATDPWSVLAEAAAKPPAEARTTLEGLLARQPDFLPGHFNLGTLLLSSDAAAAARHLARASEASDPVQAADALHNLALAQWQQGQAEMAVQSLTRAADLVPAFAPARDELRRAWLALRDAARLQAEAEARKLHLRDATLPEARVGEPYLAMIRAGGGSTQSVVSTSPGGSAPGGYVYSALGTPSPPPGLSVSANGALGGTPMTAGRTTFRVVVRDAASATASGSFTIEVLPAPAITTSELPEGVRGQTYRADMAAIGLSAPSWRARSASHAPDAAAPATAGLPPGLAFVPGAGDRVAIVGTPTQSGAYRIVFTAREAERSAERTLDLLISDSFVPDLSLLSPATAWAPYSGRAGVRGSAQEYRFTAVSGSPASAASATGPLAAQDTGLRLAQDGTLSGTPRSAGAVRFATTITAADGSSRGVTFDLPVNPPPLIDESEPIRCEVGKPLTRAIKRSGGTAPFVWSIAAGTLPTGLRLDADGSLRGAARTPGEAKLTLRLRDRWQAETNSEITIQIDPPGQPPDQQQQDPQQDPQPNPDDGKQQQASAASAAASSAASASQAEDQQRADQQALTEAAAQRFLDQLPPEDKDALRALLFGGKPPPSKGPAW